MTSLCFKWIQPISRKFISSFSLSLKIIFLSSQILTTSNTLTPTSSAKNIQTHFKTRPNPIPIAYLESEFISDDIQIITQKLFPSNFQFIKDNLLKRREFYEFILVDSNSIEITHTPSKNNASKIAFSKLKILKVISLIEWNQSIYTEKTFSQPYNPHTYNYIDYQKAWFHLLFLQPYNHSRFMHFTNNIQEFSSWFFK